VAIAIPRRPRAAARAVVALVVGFMVLLSVVAGLFAACAYEAIKPAALEGDIGESGGNYCF